jgi:hypothetical protein
VSKNATSLLVDHHPANACGCYIYELDDGNRRDANEMSLTCTAQAQSGAQADSHRRQEVTTDAQTLGLTGMTLRTSSEACVEGLRCLWLRPGLVTPHHKQTLAGIDEVNLFKNDDTVIRFTNPKCKCVFLAVSFEQSGPRRSISRCVFQTNASVLVVSSASRCPGEHICRQWQRADEEYVLFLSQSWLDARATWPAAITELMPDILSQLGQEKVQQLMARSPVRVKWARVVT